MSRKIILLIIIAIYLAGCATAPEETLPLDAPTPEPAPTDAPTPEPIPTDAPTATPLPEPGTLEEISIVFDDETGTLEEISIVFDNLFPEGIEYDENGERFLLGSMTERRIFQVFDDGTFEPLVDDPDLIRFLRKQQMNRLLFRKTIWK